MNVDPERKAKEALLDAVLKDEAWQTTEQELRTLAVDAIRGHRRRRQQWRMAAIALGFMAVIGLALRGARSWPTAAFAPVAAPNAPSSAPSPLRDHYLSDDELLSQFPPGSCVLVEVDDRRQLVFLDRDVERDHLAVQ